MNEFNQQIVAEFRENAGQVGGMFAGAPMILVHHVGAKSGVERVSPLVYLADGDRLFVFASKGGADDNPAWYHNLVANPKTTVEVGTETFDVVAKVITGAARDEIYAKQVAAAPQFGEYERQTTRVIPVVELERVSA
ncbi:MAG TPA: nitroreductase family deazaflavin-dependent oxidoreductase [Pseudonocardiaceae bacterium]|jgi:deazaflavin-dependent oxidoreductase (nitroreductase family)|nr:nitroreductase family deazaflavin-dependent oxidoreductase [Pseudonocardiaceae bacterium]